MNIVRVILLPALVLTVACCSNPAPDTGREALVLPEDTYEDSYGDKVTRVVYPNQNWDRDESLWFYNTPQGSHLLPYQIFLHLEQADNEELFRSSKNMNRLRYLPQKPSPENPDGLPVGWVKESYQGKNYVGLTCAACHTGQINYRGVAIRIDGGPTLADMDTLLVDLARALQATANDPAKLNRLAAQLFDNQAEPGSGEQDHRAALQNELVELGQQLQRYNLTNASVTLDHQVPYGFGRLDAFGRIYNRVFAHLTPDIENANPPNAPVSHPQLWDTPQHDFVQWNGVGENEGEGTLSRNVGQAIGVFATMNLDRQASDAGYTSSVDLQSLVQLEDHVEKLWSPSWNELASKNILPPINQSLAEKGRTVYHEYQCHTCHELIDRTDPQRRITARFSRLQPLNTDPVMAHNAVLYKGKSGYLEGKLSLKPPIKPFGPTVSALAAVREITEGVIRQGGQAENAFNQLDSTTTAPMHHNQKMLDFEYVDKNNPQYLMAYKARPLNGIWATAPYLHNGSVASLYELFLPSCSDVEIADGKLCRANEFTVGSRELDAEKVGFVQRDRQKYPNLFVLDTRLPGNSNKGHEYAAGVTPVVVRDEQGQLTRDDKGGLVMMTLPPITEEKRKALVEFLKTL